MIYLAGGDFWGGGADEGVLVASVVAMLVGRAVLAGAAE